MNFDETLLVVRIGKVDYVDGKPVRSNEEKYDLVCNVQPMNGKDLLLVPEMDRYKEQYWIFTPKLDCPLRLNDRVVRCGVNFQTQSTEDWGSYIRARIMRVDVGPNAS